MSVITVWEASTAYSLNDVVSLSAGDYWLFCQTAGTSGSSEPSVPTATGQTVNDGTAVWLSITQDIAPRNDNEAELGKSDLRWKNVNVAGNLSDGTNDVTVAQAKAASDHVSETDNPHGTGIPNVDPGTLAELNAAITDATLDDSSDSRTPSAHVTSHETGGSDALSHQNIDGSGTNTHTQIDTHIAATGDSVHGLGTASTRTVPSSGDASSTEVVLGSDSRLTDGRTPDAHAASHTDGTDDIQNATAAQKGLMTSDYAGDLDTLSDGSQADSLHTHSHTALNDIGTNTHAQIDTKLQDAIQLQGIDLTDAIPSDNNVLKYSSSDTAWTLGTALLGPSSSTDGFLPVFTGAGGNETRMSGASVDSDGRVTMPALDITPQSSETHQEGRLYYDSDEKCHIVYNEESEIAGCLNREFWVRVYNSSGSAITNGQVVYINGASSGWPTIELAQANAYTTSRVIGVATHDIENSSYGYVTKMGEVKDVDTSSYSAGDELYLSSATAGAITGTAPSGSDYNVRIGIAETINATTGTIYVDPITPEYASEVNNLVGWASWEDQTLAFVDGTRTLTITPTGTEFVWYQGGEQYRATTDSIVIPDEEGLFFIYYDEDTLSYVKNPTTAQVATAIRTYTLVAYIYWDATNSESVYFGFECHPSAQTGGMTTASHAYHHFVDGAVYISGLALTDITADQAGNTNSDAQFGVASGTFADEDLPFFTTTYTSTTGLDIYYLDGADGDLRKTSQAGYSVLTDVTAGVDTTGRIVFNEFTGGAWQLTAVTNNDFVMCHVFAVNANTQSERIIALIGQDEYASRAAAEAGAETEILSIVTGGLVSPEIVPIATVIFQTGDTKSNAVKSSIESTGDGSDYIDWREVRSFGGAGGETGSGTPGGSTNDIQINDGGTFGTYTDFTLNLSSGLLNMPGDFTAHSVTVDDILTSADASTSSDTALTTAGYVDEVVGAGASVQLESNFSTVTTAADPGSKNFRYDNATPASVTNIYVNDTFDSGLDGGNLIGALSTNDRIYIQTNRTASQYNLFRVTAAATDNTGWWTIPVVSEDAGSLHDNNRLCGWIVAYSSASGGGGGGLSWSVVSTATNATDGNGYMVDAGSGAVTVTLPSSPSEGDTVGIKALDLTNAITVARNGSNIEGVASDLTVNVEKSGFTLVYSDSTNGWVVVTEIASPQEIVTLTDAATVAVDLSSGADFKLTLGGNRTLGNPTNTTVGQSGEIYVYQDATGSRTLSLSSNWITPGGSGITLTTDASAEDVLSYKVETATRIHLVISSEDAG